MPALTASAIVPKTLTDAANASEPGTFPGSTTYPGSTTFPGRGNDLSDSAISPRTLTAVAA